jgi:glyoxylase-like metal-dependent hydrolase (beta-lactamase superfamily II)
VIEEVAPGLLRWSVRHPAWTPEEDWEPEVAALCYVAADDVVLIDPLFVSGETDDIVARLDAEISRIGRAPHVLLTIFWHARSTTEILERYPGARVWAHEPARELVHERTPYTDLFRPGDELPAGVQALDARRAFEVLFWLPEHRALVAGDVVLGAGERGVRLLPQEWLGGADRAAFDSAMQRLLDLPVERILPAHGAPVLSRARAALAEAIARGPSTLDSDEEGL